MSYHEGINMLWGCYCYYGRTLHTNMQFLLAQLVDLRWLYNPDLMFKVTPICRTKFFFMECDAIWYGSTKIIDSDYEK